MYSVNERDSPENELPGRYMRWLANSETLGAKNLSCCVIRVPAGSTVKPAHAHPNGEELIYIIKGKGSVYIDGTVEDVDEGSAILFPTGSIHMLRNHGNEEMKVICFFAPASDISTYKFYEDVDFPETK
jgi:quercetin dioxygenase-like cupin family protein